MLFFSTELTLSASDAVIIMPPFFKNLISLILSLNISFVLVTSSVCVSVLVILSMMICGMLIALSGFALVGVGGGLPSFSDGGGDDVSSLFFCLLLFPFTVSHSCSWSISISI